jgi:Ca2+-binding RTX toxin-like protein
MHAQTIPGKQSQPRPLFESLEQRRLMSASYSSLTGALTVTGTPGNDTISVNLTHVQSGTFSFTYTRVYENGVRIFNSLLRVRSITINSGAEDDHVTIGPGVIGCVINGGSGRDVLIGGDGKDVIDGGSNNDFIFGGAGDDMLRGGDNEDTIDCWTGNDTAYGGAHNDDLWGYDGDDKLYGEDGDDELYGEDNSDRLEGGAGRDSHYGGNGDDSIYAVDETRDVIDGGADDDWAEVDCVEWSFPSVFSSIEDFDIAWGQDCL